ncbi:hypothetical protein LTR37_015763 [Vermiconidia calcicola]|uniref:Uncharacterized protein n=1 Tax=Vermiconidia calcicola TaxID=1690605 RepID=A0ACC3MPW2_9PEZI|nr:hypothetical protein LTR37_015763 [Vermiconidia calcicola]
MEDWGNGVLQTGRDYEVVHKFDEAFGLRELRAKVNGKDGVKHTSLPNRFSINAEFCYGTHSVEIVRKYLDSGALLQLLENDFFRDRCWDGDDLYRFTVLGACAMSLGCTLPLDMKERLEKHLRPAYVKVVQERQPTGLLKPLGRAQMKKALANYKDGEPYIYGNKTMLEHNCTRMFPGETTLKEVGSSKIIEIKQKDGRVIPSMIGPPQDEELGLTPIHPHHLCATCGAEKQADGGELLGCARCQDRKYCSKGCQKRHWKFHKPICTRDAEEMRKFMDSNPPVDPKKEMNGAMEDFMMMG